MDKLNDENKKNDQNSLFLQEMQGVQPIKKDNRQRVKPLNDPEFLTKKNKSKRIILPKNSDNLNNFEERLQNKPQKLTHSRIKQNIDICYQPVQKTKLLRVQDLSNPNSNEGFLNQLSAEFFTLEYKKNIHHKIWKELKKGHIYFDEEIDLHSLSVAEAKISLVNLINKGIKEKLKCVKIIHGKGRNSKDFPAVLKFHLNHWLPQIEIVLAYCSCIPPQGGTGATLVLLKSS